MVHPIRVQAIPSYDNDGVYQSVGVVHFIGRLQYYKYPLIFLVLLIC